MPTHFWAVPKIGIPAIQIDIEAEALGRNYTLQAAVLGDAKMVLQAMRDVADPASGWSREAWIRTVHTHCGNWAQKYQPVLESDAVPIRPERICPELTRRLPEDAIV